MSTLPITLEAFEILDAIDRRGSFAKAAEELNKATSAVSYGVQKLEEQLDITVFERQGRRSVLTPAGRFILDEGRLILNATTRLADKAKELATGWEPRLRINIESTVNYQVFFQVLTAFLTTHNGIEIDVGECVLSGGWESLEQDKVDLVVGSPGPVPLQQGYRAIPIVQSDLIPVIASHHPLAKLAKDAEAITRAMPELRRVVTHDTSKINIARSAGLSSGKQLLNVQTIDQKTEAILAGLGIGHLPSHRVQIYLDSGRLVRLNLESSDFENFIAWKISHKGKALQDLCQRLALAKW